MWDFGDHIWDFETPANEFDSHDIIDLSQILGDAVNTVGQAVAGGYLSWEQSGSSTLIMVDYDGAAGPMGALTMAELHNTNAANVSDWLFTV
jgi:hypothetical protein